MDLEKLRKRVDYIDHELLTLLARRMELAVQTRYLKEKVEDPEREKALLETLQDRTRGPISGEFLQSIFDEILRESKRLQEEHRQIIGFAGEHGAFSESAVSAYDSKAFSIPHADFREVFQGVANKVLDLGIVPVENTLGGSVVQVDDLLIEHELFIVGELFLPIHHCLLAPPETNYRDLRVVYSHPQALSQCRNFLRRQNLEGRPYHDTAGAALFVGRDKPTSTAAIASSLAAELYNLNIIKENIEDREGNTTRFLVIAREGSKEPGNKCSIMFSTAHKPGTLFEALSAFSEANINMSRIESRPVPQDPGTYAFLVDFQGSKEDSAVQEALAKVEKASTRFRLLGCYPEGSS